MLLSHHIITVVVVVAFAARLFRRQQKHVGVLFLDWPTRPSFGAVIGVPVMCAHSWLVSARFSPSNPERLQKRCRKCVFRQRDRWNWQYFYRPFFHNRETNHHIKRIPFLETFESSYIIQTRLFNRNKSVLKMYSVGFNDVSDTCLHSCLFYCLCYIDNQYFLQFPMPSHIIMTFLQIIRKRNRFQDFFKCCYNGSPPPIFR